MVELFCLIDMTQAGPFEIEPEQVRAALSRLLESKTFSRSTQLRRFLELTVSRTLEGQTEDLKEYTIATEAYHRSPSYDPRLDAIVRTEAQRLRKKLAAYYEGEGKDDPVRIRYPKGSYVPTFTSTREKAKPRSYRAPMVAGLMVAIASVATMMWQRTTIGSIPRVAVLPFDDLSRDGEHAALAVAASEAIVIELTRQRGLEIVSSGASMQLSDPIMPYADFIDSLDPDYIVGGSFQRSGDQCRVTARLMRPDSGANVWSKRYSFEWSRVFEIQAEIAADVAAEIGAFIAPRARALETGPGGVTPEAYEALSRGRYKAIEYNNTTFPEYLAQAERELELARDRLPVPPPPLPLIDEIPDSIATSLP